MDGWGSALAHGAAPLLWCVEAEALRMSPVSESSFGDIKGLRILHPIQRRQVEILNEWTQRSWFRVPYFRNYLSNWEPEAKSRYWQGWIPQPDVSRSLQLVMLCRQEGTFWCFIPLSPWRSDELVFDGLKQGQGWAMALFCLDPSPSSPFPESFSIICPSRRTESDSIPTLSEWFLAILHELSMWKSNHHLQHEKARWEVEYRDNRFVICHSNFIILSTHLVRSWNLLTAPLIQRISIFKSGETWVGSYTPRVFRKARKWLKNKNAAIKDA